MTLNSRVGTYVYANPTVARHAPSSVVLNGVTTVLTYDANGNQTQGLDGKVMTYDGENRPLSVTFAGRRTCYAYGADGTRLIRASVASSTACPTTISGLLQLATPLAQDRVTVYVGGVEIERWGKTDEAIHAYPAAALRQSWTTPGSLTGMARRPPPRRARSAAPPTMPPMRRTARVPSPAPTSPPKAAAAPDPPPRKCCSRNRRSPGRA